MRQRLQQWVITGLRGNFIAGSVCNTKMDAWLISRMFCDGLDTIGLKMWGETNNPRIDYDEFVRRAKAKGYSCVRVEVKECE